MKTKLLSVFLFFTFFSFSSYAQADLVLLNNALSFSPTSVQSNDLLTIQCTVKNQGNVASPPCHIRFSISSTQTTLNEVMGIDVSVEALNIFANSQPIAAQMRIPFILTSGNYYIWCRVENRNEVIVIQHHNYYSTGNLSFTSSLNKQQNIPYPIIFIHGLADNGLCWAASKTPANYGPGYAKILMDNFGWSFGGRMDFCLNQAPSNTDYVSDVYDRTIESQMQKADYYYVNFDVDRDGTINNNANSHIESNESGITKQGVAIYYAVQHVLNVTGRDKVILVGHSMGGLAGRDYIENWTQQDGLKHIAKYFSTGTPHGGTDANTFGLQDCQSEAYRDLRNTYSYSGAAGVYLRGDGSGGQGYESNSVMSLTFCSNFYNIDVNANGVNGGDYITGLVYKPLPTDIYYSCGIGTGATLGGDGCVDTWSSNMNNWKTGNIVADTIIIQDPGYSVGSIMHQHLPSVDFAEANTRGLDEPNSSNLSYEIFPGNLYFGNISKISNWWQINPPYDYDHDWYKFTLPSAGILNLSVSNIPINNFHATIYDPSSIIGTYFNNGVGNISQQLSVTQAGQYYIDLYGEPDSSSWKYPYAFSLSFTSTSNVQEFSSQISDVMSYPNPFHDKINISFTLNENKNISLKVYNTIGQLIETMIEGNMDIGKHIVEFNGSELPSGMYYYTLQSDDYFKSDKIILEK